MTSTVTSNKCTVEVTIPVGGPTYDATRIEVEITGIISLVETTLVHNELSDITIVQATPTETGLITITNVPLIESSGNSIDIKYFSSDFTSFEVIGNTGTFVRKYD